jgi:hypothetical protein
MTCIETRSERSQTALRQYVEAKGAPRRPHRPGDGPVESTLRLAHLHFEAEHDNPEETGKDAP